MALKIDKRLQAKWEARLAAEGLAPLTTHAAAETRQRRALASRTASGQKAVTERYYMRAHKFLRRIELAHTVWQLHCEGKGRRDIAGILLVPEKMVRLVLERLHSIAGIKP